MKRGYVALTSAFGQLVINECFNEESLLTRGTRHLLLSLAKEAGVDVDKVRKFVEETKKETMES